MKYINLFCDFSTISENLKYHIENNISVLGNVFRPHSKSFYELISEARNLFENGKIDLIYLDRKLFETTDLGLFGEYYGRKVPLDLPMEDWEEILEAEYKGKKVDLNKPMRSTTGPKKYKVYVKNPKTGKVKVVHFGDKKGGLTTKSSNPGARKSFAARHRCKEKVGKPGAKLTPGYWSCVLPRYGLLKGRTSGYW
jgi:hypothetical protein